ARDLFGTPGAIEVCQRVQPRIKPIFRGCTVAELISVVVTTDILVHLLRAGARLQQNERDPADIIASDEIRTQRGSSSMQTAAATVMTAG
ncbi:MAG TPA: hypothetical protein VF852_09725, partial [Pseudolabrys sp.]